MEARLFTTILLTTVGAFLTACGDPIKNQETIKSKAATMQITAVFEAIQSYSQDVGSVPTGTNGLNALISDPGKKGWHGPYLRTLPKDPWGEEFLYTVVGPKTVSVGTRGHFQLTRHIRFE